MRKQLANRQEKLTHSVLFTAFLLQGIIKDLVPYIMITNEKFIEIYLERWLKAQAEATETYKLFLEFCDNPQSTEVKEVMQKIKEAWFK